MRQPNMSPELVEAVQEHFKDEPDIQADIFLYLSNLIKNEDMVCRLRGEAQYQLNEMGRCDKCGEPLVTGYYNEPHPELDGCPMEPMSTTYCPNCDVVQMSLFEED